MLPSTGYFKAINCPFYENGYCERPYCHFRHARRDGGSISSVVAPEARQAVQKTKATSSASIASPNPDDIQRLVSETVKQVLASQSIEDTEKIISQVVEELKPKLVPSVSSTNATKQETVPQESKHVKSVSQNSSSSCVYNPTPIAELRKRHLPVSVYQPSRESKAVRRKSPDVEKSWMDVIRNIPSTKKSKISYVPTAINQTNTSEDYTPQTYVPTSKSEMLQNLYDDEETYVPEMKRKREGHNHRHKLKKRREEYVPRRPKIPLKDDQLLEDDSFDLDDLEELLRSESEPYKKIDKESDDLIEAESKSYNEYQAPTDLYTSQGDEMNAEAVVSSTSCNEKENEGSSTNHRKDTFDADCTKVDDRNREVDDSIESVEKVSEFMAESDGFGTQNGDHLENDENKEESSIGRNEVDSKHEETEETDSKDIKQKNSKHKRDKEKTRDRDKHKHSSSKSSKEKSSSSSSKDSKSRERDREKDKEKSKDSKDKDGSHKSKKDSKSDKEKSSSSKDSKNKHKDSKDKAKSKSSDKSKHTSKSSSSDSKSRSSKSHSSKSSERRSSHSSHKSSKSNENPSTENEDNVRGKSEKSDREGKGDSPEYEEFSPFYDENLLEDSDSDCDVEEECRKIFQEYEIPDHPKDIARKSAPKTESEEPDEASRKRVAHPSAGSSVVKSVGPSQPLKRAQNPQQRMYERWRMIKEVAAERAAEKGAVNKTVETGVHKKSSESMSSSLQHDNQLNGNGRIRIAQVPYAMSLALEKKKVMERAAKVETKTAAQNKKGVTRVAHVPQVVSQLERPEPKQIVGTQKFPLNVRQFYVNAMQDICVQIYTNGNDASDRAVNEEFACYERCKALNVYKNSCMLTVHRLRKEVDQKSEDSSVSGGGMISHKSVLEGKVKGSWSVVKPKKAASDFKGSSLYNMLSKWIMTEQELRDNGFPRPHPDGPKGRAKLYTVNTRGQSTLSKVPNERFCCRCNKPYMVDKNNFPVRKENCIYHYARKFTFRGVTTYMCCKQDGMSDGCCDASTHVWDHIDVENLRGYVSTFDKGSKHDDDHGVFALDCEMCYTTEGLELTRVTVVNEDCQVVYETLVKPTHPIIDYNTRFSGISEEDMENVTTTLLEVQATLLSMFSSKTILVGHSLESDFKALKLLHDTVVDTSVMFPHKNGPPLKRALKNLCSEYLRKIIQNDVGGHDSKEDASACMELVHWKVKEEAKLQ
ncbi:hypothetical protein QAD02_023210 [Eretmocerus hayati]|uniref:Uncharacterized protein n=1 Tax=Eretmocerus hayati TaxID=131215 RepID=A0ACC2PXD1_9HYME|nr:hypothetical protein QAD02_023210 [Eretmocerus hayati]